MSGLDNRDAGATAVRAGSRHAGVSSLVETGLPVKISRARLTSRALFSSLSMLVLALLGAGLVALSVGSESIPFGTVIETIRAGITGAHSAASGDHATILLHIRVPRILLALTVGAALSVAGAAYQAILRNPLAEPGILGVSTGAALGAIVATVLADSIPIGRPLTAFLGALATMLVVYSLGHGRQGGSSERLILAGVITNAFLSSIIIFVLTTATELRMRSVFSWLIGDLSGEARLLPIVFAFVVAGAAVICVQARSLNLLMTGEHEAMALGVEVNRVRLLVFVAASLITGAAVAVSGVIGFVGLVIPHAVRLAGGGDNRLVIPASALAGAIFLLLADTVARTIIAPRELHIGVITALIGAPAFVYLLRRAV